VGMAAVAGLPPHQVAKRGADQHRARSGSRL
jgi:hypothetical protein